MTAEDVAEGWWEAPAAQAWVCPDCGVASPVDEWRAAVAGCDECGEHDARSCPHCNSVFDFVRGAEEIRIATEEAGR